MTFIHLSLLTFGGLCVAIPLAIHLMMRQRPKHQIFPALRFVKERRQANQRRMRLRHWLLLALRCAAIATFATALARPTVATAAIGDWGIFAALLALACVVAGLALLAWRNQSGRLMVGGLSAIAIGLAMTCTILFVRYQQRGSGAMLGEQEAPVSAVLLFDTSPRMLYEESSQTRLAVAQELARWLLTQLPDNSEVAIVDTGGGPLTFALDRSIASQAIDTLEVSNNSQSLPDVIEQSRRLLESARHQRHELYVFTDLSQPSWQTALTPEITRLQKNDPLLLHILDVGSLEPRNTTLGDIDVSPEWLSHGGTVQLRSKLASLGTGGEWKVELVLEDQDPRRPIIIDGKPLLPELKPRGERSVQVDADSASPFDFSLGNLAPGTHHGQIRLRGHDGLAVDNVRYFTVEVSNAWPVLIVAAPELTTRFLTDALAPIRLRETGQAKFRCDVVDYDQLDNVDLRAYRITALLDPAPLTQRQWRRLSDFVERGGGLGVFLGRRVGDVRQFSNNANQDLLPGAPRRQWAAPEKADIYLTLRDASHPMLRFFQPFKDSLAWNVYPIYRHWSLTKLAPNSVVIMRFTNDQPAIVERRVGAGRVVMMTTPISDPFNDPNRPTWNYLPTNMDPAFFMLTNEMFEYLAGGDQNDLNYLVGEPAGITVPDANDTDRFRLFIPTGTWQDVSPSDGRIRVNFTDPVGCYRLRAEQSTERSWGFSVNLPARDSDLKRIESEQLDQLFGEDRYHRARERGEINREIVEARIGRELYPWLVILTVVILVVEFLLANRFYQQGNT